MHVFRKRFSLRVPLRFMSVRQGPVLLGLFSALLLVAIAVPALYPPSSLAAWRGKRLPLKQA